MEEKLLEGKGRALNLNGLLWLLLGAFAFIVGIIIASGYSSSPLHHMLKYIDEGYWFVFVVIAFSLLMAIYFTFFGKCTYVVTNDYIIVRISDNQSKNLPIKKVSYIQGGILKSVTIGTSGGRIILFLVDDKEALIDKIKNIVIEK